MTKTLKRLVQIPTLAHAVELLHALFPPLL